MRKKVEERYALTVKGFFVSEKVNTDFLDSLELYMRRNDLNAIVLTKGFSFEKVELVEES